MTAMDDSDSNTMSVTEVLALWSFPNQLHRSTIVSSLTLLLQTLLPQNHASQCFTTLTAYH